MSNDKNDDLLGKREDHPSYGMIGISRFTCTPPMNLFGSSVKHHAAISLRINKAHKRRSLSADRYFTDDTLVEITLSAAQFAEMVATPNVGDGIPCTLDYLNPKMSTLAVGKISPCPEENERQMVHDDFKREMRNLADGLKDLVAQAAALHEKPSVTKGDREAFVKLADTLKCKIENSLPFIHAQFTEATERTVADAKANLEAFVGNLSRSLGDSQLKAQLQGTAQNLLKD
jgi:hypothetical protein